ncbi:MAG TPA: hypothetical protein VFC78_13670, partial [Tepidisphaeraceae bacterium]|nr:hypothetical protein [Tepidisphaeraceae bacterium]
MLLTASARATAPGTKYYQAVVDRLARMQSIHVRFRQETIHTPPYDDATMRRMFGASLGLPATGSLHEQKGLYVELGEFSFLDGRALYDVSYAAETIERLKSENEIFIGRTVKAYTLERAESLVEHSRTGHVAGIIKDQAKLPDEWPIDVALGLRCGFDQTWLDKSRLKQAQFTKMPSGNIAMLLESDDHVTQYRWELDSRLEYATVKFQMYFQDHFLSIDMNCGDYKDHDGIFLPGVISAVGMWSKANHQSAVTLSEKVMNIEYSLNSPDNVPERYNINYPADSLVTDVRLNVPMRAATTRPFTDRDVFVLAAAHDAKSAA